ncbi:MAG: hypothetical protein JWR67_1742 [Mucilaginibacter sp.]|jgi:hypothetical protein|nr:hypothetical protein [Mucilaginibacter sp.]
MTLRENEPVNVQDEHLQKAENNQPNAYRVDDDKNVEEKDLKRSFLFGSHEEKTGTEGKEAGGQNFGKNNLTPSGDDKNNPSQNAGYRNEYFRRTEPSEEHPEDSNFKANDQDGLPNYDDAQPYSKMKNETPKPEKVERGNGENDRPHEQESYYEGTDDNDGNDDDVEPNVPGPNELPDQQKVGEPDAGNRDERDHIET